MNRDFVSFCQMHGVLVDHLPPAGNVRRYGTEAHRHSLNGAVMFDGDWGWVQNWETMTSPAIWFPKKTLTEAEKAAYRQKVQASMKRDALRRHVAKLRMVERWNRLPPLRGSHPYLERKGLSMLGCSQLRIPASDIYKVAVLACFGSGSRPDAIERMKGVGINLLVSAIQESTTPQGKMTVFNQTVGALASAAGVQIQQVGGDAKAEAEKAGLND